MRRIERHFPRSHGGPRVDERRSVSGIIFVIGHGLRWCDEHLSESLFFGLDHAQPIAEWRQDFNIAKPHSSLGYQTPAAFAGALAATGSNASLDRDYTSTPVAQPAPYGATETLEALTATG